MQIDKDGGREGEYEKERLRENVCVCVWGGGNEKVVEGMKKVCVHISGRRRGWGDAIGK